MELFSTVPAASLVPPDALKYKAGKPEWFNIPAFKSDMSVFTG